MQTKINWTKVNWKIIKKNCLLGIILALAGSFFHLLTVDLLVIPLFFLSLVNNILAKNIKSLAGSFAVAASLILIVLLSENSQISSFKSLLFTMPIFIIGIVRAINISGGYREIAIGSLLSYFVGKLIMFIFFILFLTVSSWFVDIEAPANSALKVLMTAFVTMPFGATLWFFISLAEQIYLSRKQMGTGLVKQ